MKKIIFDNTHIYIGSIGKILFPISSRCAYLEIRIEFIDGIIALGDLETFGKKEAILIVHTYMTAAGTKIDKKSWVLRNVEENVWRVDKKYSIY